LDEVGLGSVGRSGQRFHESEGGVAGLSTRFHDELSDESGDSDHQDFALLHHLRGVFHGGVDGFSPASSAGLCSDCAPTVSARKGESTQKCPGLFYTEPIYILTLEGRNYLFNELSFQRIDFSIWSFTRKKCMKLIFYYIYPKLTFLPKIFSNWIQMSSRTNF